jgi:copper homeostasis protein
MIRPRGGDFCYTSEELETMEQDALTAKQLGADGIVFGVLQEDGRVDTVRTRYLVDMVRPLKVTFHRAFDMSRDLDKALEDIIAAGVDRVLTSGGEQKVEEGITSVQKLTQAANGRVIIMAGGGISESNVHRVLRSTQVKEIHAAVRVHTASPMRHRNEKISMGWIKGREYERVVVLEDKVRRLLEAAMDGHHFGAKVR